MSIFSGAIFGGKCENGFVVVCECECEYMYIELYRIKWWQNGESKSSAKEIMKINAKLSVFLYVAKRWL